MQPVSSPDSSAISASTIKVRYSMVCARMARPSSRACRTCARAPDVYPGGAARLEAMRDPREALRVRRAHPVKARGHPVPVDHEQRRRAWTHDLRAEVFDQHLGARKIAEPPRVVDEQVIADLDLQRRMRARQAHM